MLNFIKLNLNGLLDSNNEIIIGVPYMVMMNDQSIIGSFSEVTNQEMLKKYYGVSNFGLETSKGYSFDRNPSKPVLIFNSYDGDVSIPYRQIHCLYKVVSGDLFPIPYTTIGELPHDCIYRMELSDSNALIYGDRPNNPSIILSPTGTHIVRLLIFIPEKFISNLSQLMILGEKMNNFWGYDVDPDLYDYLNYRYRWLYIYGDSHFDSYNKAVEIVGDLNQKLSNIKRNL